MEDPLVKNLVVGLTEIVARNTISIVSDKIKKAKANKDKNKTINELEEIINNLIEDKNQLERIARSLENELIAQQLSEKDIKFIVNSIIPVIEKMLAGDETQIQNIQILKSLLSKEVLQVMQLIGFNYKEAIGKPLTQICSNSINNLVKNKNENNDNLEFQKMLIELSKDEKAFRRFMLSIGRNDLIDEDNKNDK